MQKTKSFLLLHILLLVYSMGSIFSKLAGEAELFSGSFFLYYGLVLVILAAYAIFWQQILKIIPLTTAYASKAVTVIWGLIWGLLFFKETLTVQKVLGVAVIILGIVLVVKSDEE